MRDDDMPGLMGCGLRSGARVIAEFGNGTADQGKGPLAVDRKTVRMEAHVMS
jgi:hypothetical protein